MPKSRIPSPARSQGAITPRRRIPRGSRSVGSPALSTASGRLTSVIDQFKEKNLDSFLLSPVTSRRSVLTDNTDIDEPRRKSWWKNLNENSRDIMEVLVDDKAMEPVNALEDIVDIEVLSQEKKSYTLDLPESSDNESVNSIVLPQRKLFTLKENQPKKTFGHLVGDRETLAKLHKTQTDKTINVGTKKLFQANKRSRPVFPAALLNLSPNKTTADKTKENVVPEPKLPVRNIFGSRPANKRKNIFADFIVSESEDEISDIQPKVFGFQKKVEQSRIGYASKGRDHSPTSSITTDMELDDWKHLPSSTMVEHQLDEMVAGSTPVKRARLSKLSEAKESEAGTIYTTVDRTKQSNKSLSSTPARLSKQLESQETEAKEEFTKTIDKSKRSNKSMSSPPTTRASLGKKPQVPEFETGTNNTSTDKVKQLNNSLFSTRVTRASLGKQLGTQESERNVSLTSVNKAKDLNKSSSSAPVTRASLSKQADTKESEVNITNTTDKSKQPNKSLSQSRTFSQKKSVTNVEIPAENNNGSDEDDGQNMTLEYENDEQIVDQENVQNAQNKSQSHKLKDITITEKQNKTKLVSVNDDETDGKEVKKTEEELDVLQENKTNTEESPKALQKYNEHQVLGEQKDQDEKVETQIQIESEVIATVNRSQEKDIPHDEQEVITKQAEEEHQMEAEKNAQEEISANQVNNEDEEEENQGDEINESHVDANLNSEVDSDKSQEVEVDESEEEEEDDSQEEKADENQEEAEESQEKEVEESQEVEVEESHEVEVEESQEVDASDDNNENDEENVSVEDEPNERLEEHNMNQSQDEEVYESEIDNDEETEDNENESQEMEETDNVSQEIEQEEEAAKIESENESQEVGNVSQSDDDSADDKAIATDDISDEEHEEMEVDDDDENVESGNIEADVINSEEVIEESPNVTHDTTGRNRKKVKSPEAIRHDKTKDQDSFTAKGRNTSIKKSKSMYKDFNVKPSLAPPRDSIGLSDGTRDSSAEGSGWDSHRTTRKTLRQTFGKDFTLRKSLRALVMEKAAKQTEHLETLNNETVKFPQANSTEYAEDSNRENNENVESDHEVSKRTRQTTLEMYLHKIKQQNIEKKMKMEEAIRNSLKAPQPRDPLNLFKVPTKPVRKTKAASTKQKKIVANIFTGELPTEFIEDMKYKPPKRFQPTKASWITKRLYTFFENKLEPKYNYKARIRAENLMESLFFFVKDLRRQAVASPKAVDLLKHEMARLNIINTHFEFYEFFHEYMPREVRVKVVPDLLNNIALPRDGVFSDIIRGKDK